MPLSEFQLIARYFESLAPASPEHGVVLGIGDDAAILQLPPGEDLLVSIDTLVSGVHFPPTLSPRAIGHRALAVNLSDLAAMGARPLWFTLALTLPDANEAWLAAFAEGLGTLARSSGIALVGGDTTRGPLSITIQVHGAVARGTALRRDGARPGDDLWVTGHPGLSALGLRRLQAGVPDDDPACAVFVWPEPRLAFGRALVGLATAAIDVSDGLLADAGHIAERSGCAIEIEATRLPLAEGLAALGREDALALCLAGGDDYELCFTAPPSAAPSVDAAAARLGLPCRRIGRVTEGHGARCAGYSPPTTGFQHFGGSTDA
jgi:thiamine-monophosphate kinase